MKYFMTDIHGDWHAMMILFDHVGIDFEKDRLVIGGDMINRGKKSAKVVKQVKEWADAYPNHVHVLIGNHEEMMREYFLRGDKLWMKHGGKETLKDFERSFSSDDRQKLIEWIGNLPLVYEDDEFVYTHAGLNPYKPVDHQSREILWMPEADFYSFSMEDLLKLTGGKPVIHGHTPVERICFDGARLNGDLGSNTYPIIEARGLALVNLSTMEYYAYIPFSKKIEKRKVARF